MAGDSMLAALGLVMMNEGRSVDGIDRWTTVTGLGSMITDSRCCWRPCLTGVFDRYGCEALALATELEVVESTSRRVCIGEVDDLVVSPPFDDPGSW